MPKRPEGPRRRPRVLYITPFDEPVSGPDESLLLLLAHLGTRIDPVVALPPSSPFRHRYLAQGCELVERQPSRIQRFRRGAQVAGYLSSLITSTWTLAMALRRRPIDLIHANMEVCLEAGLLARMHGVPCIFHYRGNTLDEPKAVFDALTWLWVHLGDQVLAISEGCADIFRKRGYGDSVRVLYNAIDTERFAASSNGADIRAELGLPADAALVLTVGRIHPRKDLETFTRALATAGHGQSVWLVAGSSHGSTGAVYEARVRQLARDLGVADRLYFLGARSDVPQLLRACDVFVMTSRHEGFGRAAAEAMLMGRACVLTREGAFPEIAREGQDTLLASPGDPEEFAQRVDTLLADIGLRRKLGQTAQARAFDLFDPDVQADTVLGIYRDLIEDRSAI